MKKIQTQNLVSPSNQVLDDDEDTKIQVEESADEDTIRIDTGGVERLTVGSTGKMALTTNGGGFIHNATVANDFTLTSENMLLDMEQVSITGTVTVDSGSTMVIV